jgi:hypothetical protein
MSRPCMSNDLLVSHPVIGGCEGSPVWTSFFESKPLDENNGDLDQGRLVGLLFFETAPLRGPAGENVVISHCSYPATALLPTLLDSNCVVSMLQGAHLAVGQLIDRDFLAEIRLYFAATTRQEERTAQENPERDSKRRKEQFHHCSLPAPLAQPKRLHWFVYYRHATYRLVNQFTSCLPFFV